MKHAFFKDAKPQVSANLFNRREFHQTFAVFIVIFLLKLFVANVIYLSDRIFFINFIKTHNNFSV